VIIENLLSQIIDLLKSATSISIELENITFDPKTLQGNIGKARISTGGGKNEA